MKTCIITGQLLPEAESMPTAALRPSLLQFIQKLHPQVTADDYIGTDSLNDMRAKYVEGALEEEVGQLSQLEREVIESLREHEILSASPDEDEALLHRTFGERVADYIATFGGSWKFILCFLGFLAVWIMINVILFNYRGKAPDEYPFILLNLILSCVAALQAPVIMMSQKRQEKRDRHHAQADYQINLKAELEIRHLHEKLDHLLRQHSERFLEIQQIQVELLRQIVRHQQGAAASANVPMV
jgi:uncharacterized membrane protein